MEMGIGELWGFGGEKLWIITGQIREIQLEISGLRVTEFKAVKKVTHTL